MNTIDNTVPLVSRFLGTVHHVLVMKIISNICPECLQESFLKTGEAQLKFEWSWTLIYRYRWRSLISELGKLENEIADFHNRVVKNAAGE